MVSSITDVRVLREPYTTCTCLQMPSHSNYCQHVWELERPVRDWTCLRLQHLPWWWKIKPIVSKSDGYLSLDTESHHLHNFVLHICWCVLVVQARIDGSVSPWSSSSFRKLLSLSSWPRRASPWRARYIYSGVWPGAVVCCVLFSWADSDAPTSRVCLWSATWRCTASYCDCRNPHVCGTFFVASFQLLKPMLIKPAMTLLFAVT